MIRRHEDDRVVESIDSGQPREQTSDLGVHECDLSVVRVRGEAAPVLVRRIVGGVRIEVVHPHEPGTPRARRIGRRARLRPPVQHARRGGVRLPLGLARAARRVPARQAVVVQIEAAREPEPAIQRKARDERRRRITRRVHHRRDARNIGREDERAVVVYAVADRR